MAVLITPYLHFAGTAREALEAYRAVLGGELEVTTFGDARMPGVAAERVMHARLTTPDGFTLMGSDVPDDSTPTPGTDLSICLSGDDERLREWFAGLARSGEVVVPLARQSWGSEFGILVDRFGVRWIVNLDA